jgi:hypothetical protein
MHTGKLVKSFTPVRELCFDFEAKTEVKSTGKHGFRKTNKRKHFECATYGAGTAQLVQSPGHGLEDERINRYIFFVHSRTALGLFL